MEITVSKKIRIDAAHFLPNYDGPCSRLNGHSWDIEIGVRGPICKDGMVVDFKDLSGFLGRIEKKFDHKLINDIIEIPTAEFIAKYIEMDFKLHSKKFFGDRKIQLVFIRVWETPDSCAEWRQ